MSELPSLRGASDFDQNAQTLTDRVLARVNDAALEVDRRAKASRPRSARRRSKTAGSLTASVTQSPEQVRATRSLRRVFLDMGESYREYRRSSGEPVSEDVRAAAVRFRREVNLTALVSVAASLDRIGLLPW